MLKTQRQNKIFTALGPEDQVWLINTIKHMKFEWVAQTSP